MCERESGVGDEKEERGGERIREIDGREER
jgi:hypothetical protein